MQEQLYPRAEAWRRPLWIALLVTAAAAFSLGFACAMPFAALCAIAACTLPRRDAYYLAGAVWGANQVIGFAFLHYPWTANSLAWGAALGLAALFCTAAARWVRGRLTGLRPLAACAVAFPAAFVVFEAVLLAFSLPLGGVEDFMPSVVAWVFAVNAFALVGFLALNEVAALLGITNPSLAFYRRMRNSAPSAAPSMPRMSS